ncbi:MAG: nucleotidyltransferase domain-containing protein [Candidatus Moranbacteria bacterium]|nr:nucleotidyltransferase domain-containing protein [Candidatus Moranbacteria bacterium]
METQITNEKIQEVADKIVKEYQPEKIILFGSYAWGTPHEDSDVDLFIIKETQVAPLARIEMVDKIFSRREFPMDFLVYTPEQVERRIAIKDLFIKDVITNGKILYAK